MGFGFPENPLYFYLRSVFPCRINSFPHILTRSSGPGIRPPQVLNRPALASKTPQGQPSDGAIIPSNKRPGDDTGRGQHDEDDPPTSPIEDPSMQDALPPVMTEMPRKTVTASGSTKLCLEVKERVARHVAMKRRDKVIPLSSRGMEPGLPRRPSTGVKNQFQEKMPALQDSSPTPSRSSSPSHVSDAEQPPKPKNTRRSQVPPKLQKSKVPKAEKQGPVTPAEYARQLMDKANIIVKRKTSTIKFLEGKNIFYIGGDMQFAGERTRGRMELVCH